MRFLILLASVAAGVLLAAGCGGRAPRSEVDVTLSAPETLLVVAPSGLPARGKEGGEGESALARAPADTLPPDPRDMIPGYRVQLFTSGSLGDAEALREEARRRIQEPVYVEYHAPLYRVRAGDCLDTAGAEELRSRLLGAGFGNAVVVATHVVRARAR